MNNVLNIIGLLLNNNKKKVKQYKKKTSICTLHTDALDQCRIFDRTLTRTVEHEITINVTILLKMQ